MGTEGVSGMIELNSKGSPLPDNPPVNHYELAEYAWGRALAALESDKGGTHGTLAVLQCPDKFVLVGLDPLMTTPEMKDIAVQFIHGMAAKVGATGFALIMEAWCKQVELGNVEQIEKANVDGVRTFEDMESVLIVEAQHATGDVILCGNIVRDGDKFVGLERTGTFSDYRGLFKGVITRGVA